MKNLSKLPLCSLVMNAQFGNKLYRYFQFRKTDEKRPSTRLAKQTLVAVLLSCLLPSVFAQGWINFANSPATLFSVRSSGGAEVGINGTYYFCLLTAQAGTVDPAQFSFSGVYATNASVAGRFSGGTFLPVPNWEVGGTKAYLIAGWSSSLGSDWQAAWLDRMFSRPGYFGLSSIGTGVAGGVFDTNKPPIPPLNLFGGTGIQSGFSLFPVGVPEPAAVAIAAAGIAVLTLFCSHRRSLRGGNSIWIPGGWQLGYKFYGAMNEHTLSSALDEACLPIETEQGATFEKTCVFCVGRRDSGQLDDIPLFVPGGNRRRSLH